MEMDSQQHEFQKLNPKAIVIWRISGFLTTLFLSSALGVGVYFAQRKWEFLGDLMAWIIGGFFIGLLLLIFLSTSITYKRWRYRITDDYIETQSGLIFVDSAIIPVKRVQHIVVEEGPILRAYKMASISIHTAATEHEIPILEKEEALRVRNRIAELAKISEDDV
jgi:membrane protein YdbS with pleckstrin-like domain